MDLQNLQKPYCNQFLWHEDFKTYNSLCDRQNKIESISAYIETEANLDIKWGAAHLSKVFNFVSRPDGRPITHFTEKPEKYWNRHWMEIMSLHMFSTKTEWLKMSIEDLMQQDLYPLFLMTFLNSLRLWYTYENLQQIRFSGDIICIWS